MLRAVYIEFIGGRHRAYADVPVGKDGDAGVVPVTPVEKAGKGAGASKYTGGIPVVGGAVVGDAFEPPRPVGRRACLHPDIPGCRDGKLPVVRCRVEGHVADAVHVAAHIPLAVERLAPEVAGSRELGRAPCVARERARAVKFRYVGARRKQRERCVCQRREHRAGPLDLRLLGVQEEVVHRVGAFQHEVDFPRRVHADVPAVRVAVNHGTPEHYPASSAHIHVYDRLRAAPAAEVARDVQRVPCAVARLRQGAEQDVARPSRVLDPVGRPRECRRVKTVDHVRVEVGDRRGRGNLQRGRPRGDSRDETLGFEHGGRQLHPRGDRPVVLALPHHDLVGRVVAEREGYVSGAYPRKTCGVVDGGSAAHVYETINIVGKLPGRNHVVKSCSCRKRLRPGDSLRRANGDIIREALMLREKSVEVVCLGGGTPVSYTHLTLPTN